MPGERAKEGSSRNFLLILGFPFGYIFVSTVYIECLFCVTVFLSGVISKKNCCEMKCLQPVAHLYFSIYPEDMLKKSTM